MDNNLVNNQFNPEQKLAQGLNSSPNTGHLHDRLSKLKQTPATAPKPIEHQANTGFTPDLTPVKKIESVNPAADLPKIPEIAPVPVTSPEKTESTDSFGGGTSNSQEKAPTPENKPLPVKPQAKAAPQPINNTPTIQEVKPNKPIKNKVINFLKFTKVKKKAVEGAPAMQSALNDALESAA